MSTNKYHISVGLLRIPLGEQGKQEDSMCVESFRRLKPPWLQVQPPQESDSMRPHSLKPCWLQPVSTTISGSLVSIAT